MTNHWILYVLGSLFYYDNCVKSKVVNLIGLLRYRYEIGSYSGKIMMKYTHFHYSRSSLVFIGQGISWCRWKKTPLYLYRSFDHKFGHHRSVSAFGWLYRVEFSWLIECKKISIFSIPPTNVSNALIYGRNVISTKAYLLTVPRYSLPCSLFGLYRICLLMCVYDDANYIFNWLRLSNFWI